MCLRLEILLPGGAVEAVVGVLVPGGEALVKVTELGAELLGSRRMFENLLEHLQEVDLRLRTLINSDVVREKEALRQYEKLVTDLRAVLEHHLKRKFFARSTAHWTLKNRVQQFETQIEMIKALMDLDREINIMTYLEKIQLNQEARDAQTDLLLKLQPTEFAKMIKREKVTISDLVDFKNEIKANGAAYSKDDKEEMLVVLKNACAALDVRELPHVGKWYLPAGDIVYVDGDPFTTSEDKLRALYAGTIILGSKVTVKTIRASNDPDDIKQFNNEAKMWHELHHPHILPLYGANNTGNPLLLVMGRAELGNFREYLATHPHRVWSLFLDAARGLAYLHKNKICHTNLKCNNLLVTAEGVGVVSDFAFAFVRTNSAMSIKLQAPSYPWKAPERYKDPNGRFESDVYALGMCLFEAFTGSTPYSDVDERTAIEMIKSGRLPAVPAGVNIPMEADELIKQMCKREFTLRVKLNNVINTLTMLAAREHNLNEFAQCDCVSPSCSACRRSIPSSQPIQEPVCELA